MLSHPEAENEATRNFLFNEYCQLWEESGVDSAATFQLIRNFGPELFSAVPVESPLPSNSPMTLSDLRDFLGECLRCDLSHSRTNLVFGSGNPRPRLVFIGSNPAPEEDLAGLPFQGPAGQLLTNIIEAMGFSRDEVYLTTTVKCRPPENREPSSVELETCGAFLKLQIKIVAPEIIIALGDAASRVLSGRDEAIASIRGEFHPLIWDPKILVMPTYSPEHLLKDPSAKRAVWEDMKKVKARLEIKNES